MSTALDRLKEQIVERVARGEFAAALDFADEAVALAEAGGETEQIDRAVCNRASLLVALGRGDEVISPLRRILMRSCDAATRFHAAYAVSTWHDEQEESDKSLFYARQAERYAEETGDTTLLYRSRNRLANIQLLGSWFEEAREGYRAADQLADTTDSLDRALLLSNVGYCEIVLGAPSRGFRDLVESLRMLRRLRLDRWEHCPRLGLAYLYLELARPERARRHAARALALAEGGAEADKHVKNALYLLGEAEKLCGHDLAAYERFHELQRRFYPHQPMVVDVLMQADVRQLVHLMA